jgi:hypothetical protein
MVKAVSATLEAREHSTAQPPFEKGDPLGEKPYPLGRKRAPQARPEPIEPPRRSV